MQHVSTIWIKTPPFPFGFLKEKNLSQNLSPLSLSLSVLAALYSCLSFFIESSYSPLPLNPISVLGPPVLIYSLSSIHPTQNYDKIPSLGGLCHILRRSHMPHWAYIIKLRFAEDDKDPFINPLAAEIFCNLHRISSRLKVL